MKFAFISDIHSNPDAFGKVLAYLKAHPVDKIICLGDIVGYGYDPNACIELANKVCNYGVKGNHEAGVLGERSLSDCSYHARIGMERQRKEIVGDNRLYIKGLPYIHCDWDFNFCCVHGTLDYPDRFYYMRDDFDFMQTFRAMGKMNICFCGHTHNEMAVTNQGDKIFHPKDIAIKEGVKYIINAGSVGYPRMHPRTTFCIYDTNVQIVSFVRLPFDFKGYVDNLERRNIPVPSWVEELKNETFDSETGLD